MIEFSNIEGIYFVGIGGIGMSALAQYFLKGGYAIAGYDRSETQISHSLSMQGCHISYEDNTDKLPDQFTSDSGKGKILVVYTPAIPVSNKILAWFRDKGYKVYKRSEILGEISKRTDTLAVAGTHGKTTVSAMTAHLLKQSHVDCSAFLGGISKNYNTNLLLGEGRYTVIEADEYDRSFHRLEPLMAVVTSMDADHLDIYGNHISMIKAYNEFVAKIRGGGKLIVNSSIRNKIVVPENVVCYTYGPGPGSDYRYFDIKHNEDFYCFNIKTPETTIADLHFAFPGLINIENLTAAIAISLMCGVTEQEIRKAAILFQGVRRRFDIRVNRPGLVYVDDYAHHPEEIKAFISSIKEYFAGRRITGIFQPHLFTRTRDHAEGFARVLDELDEVILLPIYPARENPIEGISSEMILRKMKSGNARLLSMGEITSALNPAKLDVLLTIGAGDIDNLVIPVEEMLKNYNR